MARSRRQAWLRDELILALHLYRRQGRNPPPAAVQDLSETLRAIPIEAALAASSTFRNPNGVRLKISNFVAIDPVAETTGMNRGGRADQEVFDEFWHQPEVLATIATAIRSNLDTVTIQEADYIECHHVVPLSALQKGAQTKLKDLSLVCANCHRMIHRRKAWLTMEALRKLLEQ